MVFTDAIELSQTHRYENRRCKPISQPIHLHIRMVVIGAESRIGYQKEAEEVKDSLYCNAAIIVTTVCSHPE